MVIVQLIWTARRSYQKKKSVHGLLGVGGCTAFVRGNNKGLLCLFNAAEPFIISKIVIYVFLIKIVR